MWWCEAAGMWHSDPWQLHVLDGPGLGNRKELGGERLAPWPWGGMEGRQAQGGINSPTPQSSPEGFHPEGRQAGTGVFFLRLGGC